MCFFILFCFFSLFLCVYRLDTDWIQIGYRLDTDWIQYVYTMDTKCIHSLKVSIYAAFSCFGSLVFCRICNNLATTWQSKKNPSFSAGAKFLKL